MTPAELDTWVHARLAAEEKAIAQLLAVTGQRSVENTLIPFDEAQNRLFLATYQTSLLYATNRKVEAKRDEMGGLPADFLASHKPMRVASMRSRPKSRVTSRF